MKVSDRYRRAVVGLGSAALAGALGLGVHFVADDRIGVRAGELAGGDALAEAVVAQPLSTAAEGVKVPSVRGAPVEELPATAKAASEQEPASRASTPNVSEEDRPSGHSGTSSGGPAEDSSASEDGKAEVEEPAAAVSHPEPADEATNELVVSSGSPGIAVPQTSADPETQRVSSSGEVESEHETEPSEDEPEPHEVGDDPSSTEEPEDD